MESNNDNGDLSEGFDPCSLIESVKRVAPELTWLPEALMNCNNGNWESRAYVYYVSHANANKPGSAWQHETTLGFHHEGLGHVVIDILKGNRVGGIEFIDKIPFPTKTELLPATMKLLEGISPTVIAHQCDTSAEMIRLHYSHLTAQMFKKKLIGNESGELTKLVRKYADLA